MHSCSLSVVVDWNKDWKQGKYPRTEEERAAAARKYGLRPEHYEPCDDDGVGFGDYPKLPIVHYDQREQEANYEFHDAMTQRHYGEPVSSTYCTGSQKIH